MVDPAEICTTCGSKMRLSYSRIGVHGYRVRRRICTGAECGDKTSTVELPYERPAFFFPGLPRTGAGGESTSARSFAADPLV